MRYFLITGLDDGTPIKPHIVETKEANFPEMFQTKRGDFVRYYEPLTKEEVDEHVRNGIELR